MESLVLSPSFEPVARVPWQRAITLWFEGKVEVVESHDASVRSVTLEMRVPSVVRFVQAIRPRRKAIKFSRENVWARDRGRCQYCGLPVQRSEFSYDHVLPRRQGGQTTWANVVVCCTPCNQKKGGRTPAQAGMALRAEPVKPKKLPETIRFCLTWVPGMPLAWRQWLRDASYWHGKLNEE